MKPGHSGILRIVKATGYSVQGFAAAWRFEAAFRQEVLLFAVLTALACWLPVTLLERIVLVSCLFVVLITELLNSAIEVVVDRIGCEHHELSGRAKDIGSAAVFVSLALTVTVWSMVVVNLVLTRFQ
ncbi:diacylglycerol kinase [Pseudoalteromonas fenneropenaei]|uniref:Diacylglycerol kinase n=1 Tax=Pseudoalteromonas fenneropenaei TaxID=1737459 RepID=A0ABV7CQ88_9GAMM